MNNGFNSRYMFKPNEAVQILETNNKYIHIGDVYINNMYSNNYYTSIVNLNLVDLLTQNVLDVKIAINNNNKSYTVIVNRNSEYLKANNIFCVLTKNQNYVEYKIEIYIKGVRQQYNLNCFHYDISKWSQFVLDENYSVVNDLPVSITPFTQIIDSKKILSLSPTSTESFILRMDINKIELKGYTTLSNQSTFKNISVLFKNYKPNETVYFINPIHDDTNNKWFTGYFKWEANTNNIVLLDSTIDSNAPIDYTIYWNVEYYSNYFNW